MNKLLTIVLLMAVVGNFAFTTFILLKGKPKTAFLYVDKAYDAFKGKTEIEKEFKMLENKQNAILDSIRFTITDLEGKMKVTAGPGQKKIQQLLQGNYNNYDRLVKSFSEYNGKESQKHMQSLLKQINQYVKDYGDDNGYDFIYGANGSGSLMYAGEKHDVTQEVIQYINKQYDGKK